MPRPNVSQQRKLQILDAATEIFTNMGLNTARMEDIAAEAGISKGTIYLYYASKEGLIEALLYRLFQPLDAQLESLFTNVGSIQDRLLNYTQGVLGTFGQINHLAPLILELFALARRQEYAGKIFGAYFVRYRDGLQSIFQSALEANLITLADFDGDPRQAAFSYMATIEGILLLGLINDSLLNIMEDGLPVMRSWLNQLR